MVGDAKNVVWRRKLPGGLTIYYARKERRIIVTQGINRFQYDALDYAAEGTDRFRISIAAAYLFSANTRGITMDKTYRLAEMLGLYRGVCNKLDFDCKDVELVKEVKE